MSGFSISPRRAFTAFLIWPESRAAKGPPCSAKNSKVAVCHVDHGSEPSRRFAAPARGLGEFRKSRWQEKQLYSENSGQVAFASFASLALRARSRVKVTAALASAITPIAQARTA